MLKKLILKNFKTFKEETIIDFTATKFKGIVTNNVNENIVKGGVFIGSNGSGKTTIIESIKLLLDLLFKNENIMLNFYVCLFGDRETKLTYDFLIDRHDINYSFSFNNRNQILTETLSLDNRIVLDRNGTNATINVDGKENFEFDSNDISSETLFLKRYYFMTKFTNNIILSHWMTFLQNSGYFNSYNKRSFQYDLNKDMDLHFYKKAENINKINNLFKENGFSSEISYENEKELSPIAKIQMIDNEKTIFFKKGNLNYWLPMRYESEGNKTLIHMLPNIFYAITTNGIFLFDEFSSGFSNELEEFIIKYLMENMQYSQSFFVTHSTNVLKSNILRPDQIYSVIFNDVNDSSVNRFSEESPRETQNYEKMILSGINGKRTHYGKNKD